MNNFHKTKICEDWETFKSCRYGKKCKFAHGNKELRIVMCKYGDKCYDKSCKFKHPEKNYVNLYNLDNLEISEDKKDKNKILDFYIEELKKHINICENNWSNVHDFLGPLLKKELVNIRLLNDILQKNNVGY